jgi:hypothetical protein
MPEVQRGLRSVDVELAALSGDGEGEREEEDMIGG